MFKLSSLLVLSLALALPAYAEPPAAPKAISVPVEIVPAPDPAAFTRLLSVLHGEVEDAAALQPGEAPAKPVRLTGVAAKAEPLFAQAAARREAGDAAGAKEALHQILALPRLELEVARELRLVGEGDGILVRGIQHRRQRHAPHAGVVEELAQEEGRALAALGLHQRIEGFQPLARLRGIGVRRIHPPEGGSDDVRKVGHGGMLDPAQRK